MYLMQKFYARSLAEYSCSRETTKIGIITVCEISSSWSIRNPCPTVGPSAFPPNHPLLMRTPRCADLNFEHNLNARVVQDVEQKWVCLLKNIYTPHAPWGRYSMQYKSLSIVKIGETTSREMPTYTDRCSCLDLRTKKHP